MDQQQLIRSEAIKQAKNDLREACPHDEPLTRISLDIHQSTGLVIMHRTRSCAYCSTLLEPTHRYRLHDFPTTPEGWRILVGNLLGRLAWNKLTQAIAGARREHWKPKWHLVRHPWSAKRHHAAICDRPGHRTNLDRLTTDPRKLLAPGEGCRFCLGHARFQAIWEGYRTRGMDWAQGEPDPPPGSKEWPDIAEAWGSR